MDIYVTIMRSAEEKQRYTVPVHEYTTVVDVLEWIRNRLDNTLVFRHSCHHGSCGTCGVLVNGKLVLACTTRIAELLKTADADAEEKANIDKRHIMLSPMSMSKQVKDLLVDTVGFFQDFPAINTLRNSEVNKNSKTPSEINAYQRFENCIECGLCEAVCPITSAQDWMGPAALAAYGCEIEKNPEKRQELLQQVDNDRGVWACDKHFACSKVCPNAVFPAKHIAVMKRQLKKH